MQDFNVTIIDFNDSFSLNISSTLLEMNIKSCLLHYSSIQDHDFNFEKANFIILGPGPGHPTDYSPYVQKSLDSFFHQKNVFVLGICLGHQLILSYMGAQCKKRKYPVHGQCKEINIPNWPAIFEKSKLGKRIFVQEYNSLFMSSSSIKETSSIKLYSKEDEIIMSSGSNFLTYQFHPESIGTGDPFTFFKFIKRSNYV